MRGMELKAFFLRYRKRHLWLLALLVLLAAFFALRNVQPVMQAAAPAAAAFRRQLGRLCGRISFSVAELLCVLVCVVAAGLLCRLLVLAAKGGRCAVPAAVRQPLLHLTVLTSVSGGLLGLLSGGAPLGGVLLPWLLAAVVWLLLALLLRQEKRRKGYGVFLTALCCGLTVYTGFCWLWGTAYTLPGFQQQSGIYAQPVAVEDLYRVTVYFAEQLNAASERVPRDAEGQLAASRQQILRESASVYSGVEESYPFLKMEQTPPKAIHFSRVMSLLDFTGFYCPFTGESNVNIDSPVCLLPSTVAHELAHQRGIASEQECNFLAILSSTGCGLEDYAYSGWLLGYIHLGNALYSADRERWETVYGSLREEVRADLQENNAYWQQFRNSVVKKASNTVYDHFLKGYGVEDGLRSYGTVVDLLVAYYGTAAG